MSTAQANQARSRKRAGPSTPLVELADLATQAGLALATQDTRAVAAVRVQLGALDSACPGVALVSELLAGYEEAQRVGAERRHQLDAHKPLRESVLLELINKGPLAPSELVTALGGARHPIVYALHKLEADGLISASMPPVVGGRPRRRYEPTSAGLAAAMGG